MTRLRQKLRPNRAEAGFTLLEIAVALLIGAVLIGGMIQLFASNKQTYRNQEAMSRLQENGRFAMQFITRDLRQAGYRGCLSRLSPSSKAVTDGEVTIAWALNDTAGYLYDFGEPLQALEGSTLTDTDLQAFQLRKNATTLSDMSAAAGDLTVRPHSGSDILTLRYAENTAALLQADMTANTDTLSVNTGNDLAQNDIVVLSDCEAEAIFQITNSNPAAGSIEHVQAAANGVSIGNSSASLGHVFTQSAELLKTAVKTYYVADGEGGTPSLWVLENDQVLAAGNNPRELIEGVEDMQVLYGIDTDTSDGEIIANTYVMANVVSDWDTVVSVRLTLSVQTLDDNVADNAVAGDRRLRRTFTATISLRNNLT